MKNIISWTFFCLPSLVFAQITSWNYPAGIASDKYYEVKANGTSIPVFDTPVASYAVFSGSGEVKLEITTMFDVRWVDVRPKRLSIEPAYVTDNSFSISLPNPENISLELNGRIRQQPLFILYRPNESNKPSKTDKNVIWFESGKLYKDVNLELQGDQTVYIEGGAVVQGGISARGKRNVSVRGYGILDGSLNSNRAGNENKFIQFTDCKKVEVNGVILQNGTTWQIAVFNCDDVTIKKVAIISEAASDDGIDLVRCTNALVEGVFAHTKDDCIAIKSNGDYPADHPTENIVVRNCTFWNSLWGNAIEIGFELYSNEVKNIRVENCDVIHVEDGAAMSIHNAGPARVHDITFENIRVEDSSQKLLDVAIFYSFWSPDGNHSPDASNKNYLHGAWDGVQRIPPGTEKFHRACRGAVDHILFKDIQITGGGFPFSVLHGFDREKTVSEITIENLTYLGKKISNMKEARIRTQNVTELKFK